MLASLIMPSDLDPVSGSLRLRASDTYTLFVASGHAPKAK
jgi:hypothetical protein